MLKALDIFLACLHIGLVCFNLTGWIWRRTRKAHLISISATAFCWFILGIWYGIGYCPITDWQWQVKEKLGQHDLPDSFIAYYMQQLTGHHFDPTFVDNAVAVCFGLATLLTIYVNFIMKKKKTIQQ